MLKYYYVISYRCRPNKKRIGSFCAMNITLSRSLDKPEEQAKVLKMLTIAHRVNPDAIENLEYRLEKRELAFVAWVRDKFAQLREAM